ENVKWYSTIFNRRTKRKRSPATSRPRTRPDRRQRKKGRATQSDRGNCRPQAKGGRRKSSNKDQAEIRNGTCLESISLGELWLRLSLPLLPLIVGFCVDSLMVRSALVFDPPPLLP
ncbi:hypothetical protein BHM03_00038546, partial [Ensete ventricosum]